MTVQKPLHAMGLKTSTVALLSNDQLPETHPDITLREAEAINKHVEKLLDFGEDVLVVMHSYAGVPGTQAMKGLSKKERKDAGKKNGVVGLVYMCAFMLWEGARILEDTLLIEEASAGKLKFSQTDDGWQECTNPMECFYQDAPPKAAQAMAAQLVRRDGNLARAQLTYSPYKLIPSTYIHAEQDMAIVIAMQEYMINQVRSHGNEVETIRWNTGHSPFLVDAQMVADFLKTEAHKRSSV